jgi:hypothetical protein
LVHASFDLLLKPVRVVVTDLKLDLLLLESVPVQELLVALQANVSSVSLVRIFLWVGSLFTNTVAAVGLSTELAELELLDVSFFATGVAHERQVSHLGHTD